MMDLKKYLGPVFAWGTERLSEPSTWAANALLPIVIHVVAPGALGDKITAILSFACLTIAGAAKEGTAK